MGISRRVVDLKPGDYIDATALAAKYPDGAVPGSDVGIVNHVTPSDTIPGKVFLRSAAFTGDVDPDDTVDMV